MTDALNDIARGHIAQHGLGSEISDLVELWLSPLGEDGEERANISVGYTHGGRRRETAMVSLPTLDDAMQLLASRDRTASILSLGIHAMPAASRPAVPDWIRDSEDARRTRQSLRRASTLSDAEARGAPVDKVQKTGPDTPF